MEGMLEELAALEMRLLQDGSPPPTGSLERLIRLWRLYLRTEASMDAARLELKTLQGAHEKENGEFHKKFDQIRALAAQQNSFSMKVAEENQQLLDQLKQQQLEKEAQKMEVAQLLHQEGLEEIVSSCTSEQVAYLLAERASLLEKLQALEVLAVKKCPASPECPAHTEPEPVAVFKDGMDKLSFHKAVPSRGQSSWKKLLGLRKAAQSKQKPAVSAGGEPWQDGSVERLHLERDLDEASCRLSMAHKEIRRLTDELESARMTQRAFEPELQSAQQEVELLRQEVEKLRLCDVAELRKATELNERLEKEIRILRDRVRCMDSDRMALLAMVDKKMMEVSDSEDEDCPLISPPKVERAEIAIQTVAEDVESAHLRCLEDLGAKDLEVRELQERMQELQHECSQLQLQKDQALGLLEEQEQKHSSTVEALKRELEFLEMMVKQESQKTLVDDYKALAKAQECLVQQKSDECAQMSEILEDTCGLLRTAEGEVLSGKEKIAELEELRAQLDHRNKEVLAELQQALARLSKLEQSHEAQTAEYQQALARASELEKNRESWAAESKEASARVSELERSNEVQAAECQQALARASEVERNRDSWAGQLKEASARVSELEQKVEAQSAELQKLLEKNSGLQVHLVKEQNLRRQNQQEFEELQVELKMEKECFYAKEKEVFDLQQQFKSKSERLHTAENKMQHFQELLQRATCEIENFKMEAKASADTVSNLQATVEDHFEQRRLWLQREEVLQQEVRILREQEASLKESAERHQHHIQELLAQQRKGQEVCAKLQEAQDKETQLELKLQAKTESLSAAQGEVLDLQKELRNQVLQLDLERAETKRLKKEAEDVSDDLAMLRTQAQEAEKQRQWWLCREDVMQQEVKTLQDRQASLEAQLAALRRAEQAARQELQASSLDMNDKLHAREDEVLALQEELKKTLREMDTQLTMYNEKKCNFKDKLSHVKQSHINEMRLRDDKIKELQRKCDFLTKKVDKVTELTKTMDEVNTNLLKENRQLQCQLLKEQEAQCETLNVLRTYELSAFPKGRYTMHDLFDLIQKEGALESESTSPTMSLTRTPTSEIGYLNLTPPLSPPNSQSQARGSMTGGDETPQTESKKPCLTERFL